MKIIHIINDDKFPSSAHKAFEAVFPNQNEFVVFTDAKELTFIGSLNPKIYNRYYLWFDFIIRVVVKADIVVIHNMCDSHMRILNALSKTTKTIWIGWGFDYYDLIDIPLLKEKTKIVNDRLLEKRFSLKKKLKLSVQKIIFGDMSDRNRKRKLKIVNKATIFSPVIYEDYELLINKFPYFQPKYVDWNYGNLLDSTVRSFEGSYVNGKNILFGNSATATNNHLELFDLLSNIDLTDRKIVAPLSYGDADYGEVVIDKGRELFGDLFMPLTDFMPLDQYVALLLSCSVVVMNHLRQQAVSNVVIGLYLGAKVFLDKSNPVYDCFMKKGIYIYSLEQLEGEHRTMLSIEQIEHNRRILHNQWGEEAILRKTKDLVEATLKL